MIDDNKIFKVSYTFVMADLFHYGHLQILKIAKENSDYHICGVLSDDACRHWQGTNVCSYTERAAVIENLTCVDEVVRQETLDPSDNLKQIRFRFPAAKIVVVHGDDWKAIPGTGYMLSEAVEIIQPPFYPQLAREAILDKFRHNSETDSFDLRHDAQYFRVNDVTPFSPAAPDSLLSTKAQTLQNFQRLLRKSRIEKIFFFSVQEFMDHSDQIVNSIADKFPDGPIIVRSSCSAEDLYCISNAGCFTSVAGVDPNSPQLVKQVVQTVINSYRQKGSVIAGDQVLVQYQNRNVRLSGVVFTRNLETNTPYYLINYDTEGKRTYGVTGGIVGNSIWIHRGLNFSQIPTNWLSLIEATREIESHLNQMVLDIEFVEDENDEIIINQIRPLAANIRCSAYGDDRFNELIARYTDYYCSFAPVWDSTPVIFSDMAFWNPAEIIGHNPRPLAYSLYRELITKQSWNKGLIPLGYTNVRSELMERIGNKPYINVDNAFAALVPASLDEDLRTKLVSVYKQRLRQDLTSHDKIEFEITFNCFDLETRDRLTTLKKEGFNDPEVSRLGDALQQMTIEMISRYEERLAEDRVALKRLTAFGDATSNKLRNSTDTFEMLRSFTRLLAAIANFGTIQFTTVAREAFVSRSLCRSLIRYGGFSQQEMDQFMEGLVTVATEFDRDFHRFVSGHIPESSFMLRYGHLRSGTYDITAPRYDQVQNWNAHTRSSSTRRPDLNQSSGLDLAKLRRALAHTPFASLDALNVGHFCMSALEEREYFKFEFTRQLSLAMELLAKVGDQLEFSREDLSYLDLSVIQLFRFMQNPRTLAEYWGLWIEKMRESYKEKSRLVLPAVIQHPMDLRIIRSFEARPNFITGKRVEAQTIDIQDGKSFDIAGKIVIILQADPGFDWIFTKGIAGLITMYGGPASHMAIRCAEFGVPAAIGCGEQIFRWVSRQTRLILDCSLNQILPS